MTASCHSERGGGAQCSQWRAGMPKATNRQSPSSPWYGSVHDKDRVIEEPCAVKVACTECAVRRFVASLMQSGGTWRSAFLGHLVYLDAKARGDKSMPGKWWSSGG